MSESMSEWIEIGKIVAPQGLKGEVRVYPSTDFPDRFLEPGQRWLLSPGGSEPQPVELLDGRYLSNKSLYIVQLAGVETVEEAEALRGSLLLVPESDRPLLEEGEYHVRDLINLPVFLQETGELVGTVVDVISAGHDVLVVAAESKSLSANLSQDDLGSGKKHKAKKPKKPQLLIPFVMEIVPVVDLELGRIEITPPPGLLDVNNY
jgi:16S rRNA processing protein RimM